MIRILASKWSLLLVFAIMSLCLWGLLGMHESLRHPHLNLNTSILDGDFGAGLRNSKNMESVPAARVIKPVQLMAELENRLASGSFAANAELSSLPKLIHQSWVDEDLPAKFLSWRRSWRIKNPEWSYVLWTDDDNRELITRFFPWFLDNYEALPAPIMKADVCRNFYMLAFGGIYADLDTECLRPLEYLFNGTSADSGRLSTDDAHAFFGRMGTDEGFKHSLPNAWFASQPGHPIWVLPVIQLLDRFGKVDHEKWAAEDATGPIALFRTINQYKTQFNGSSGSISEFVRRRPEKFDGVLEYLTKREHTIHIFDREVIFPVNWAQRKDAINAICMANGKRFDSNLCKQHVMGSFMVTYWSHSWDLKNTHSTDNLARLKEIV